MTTTDTRAALEAAIDDYGNATAREAMNADERAALHRAITAHVEAEVARAMACAPEVEEAIVNLVDEMIDVGTGKSIRIRTDAGGNPMRMVEVADLRAAIAADKAREVEAVISSAFAKLLPGRPTPDEARRLVEALENAAFEWGMRRNSYGRDETTAARTALLRALGAGA